MATLLEKYPWLHGLLDTIYPPLCVGCGEYCEDEFSICRNCLTKFDRQIEPVCLNCSHPVNNPVCGICFHDSLPLFAYAYYKEPLDEVIKQYKFRGIIKSAELFAREVCEKYEDYFSKINSYVLVPVPLYKGRENVRGFNQATLFSSFLSKHLNVDVNEEILIRTKKRKPQSQLKHEQRQANIKGAFETTGEECLGEIILVDDVVTSGHTIMEARRILTKAGYNVAGVIAIAHAH